MGMYTELIFGASLKKDTPEGVINALKYIIGETREKPSDFPLPEGRCEWLLMDTSYYFGVSDPISKMWFDDIGKQWCISTRSNIKNCRNEIQAFLEWVKPYIKSGSGLNDMYAIVIYEESETPDIYYLTTRTESFRDYKQYVWEFRYCDNTFESSSYTMSLHKTSIGAFKAMQKHKLNAYSRWLAQPASQRKCFKFGWHEDWNIRKTEIFE